MPENQIEVKLCKILTEGYKMYRITGYQLRWFKSSDDADFRLQYREAIDGFWQEWKDIPHILEGIE
jgi:hypothetical protein